MAERSAAGVLSVGNRSRETAIYFCCVIAVSFLTEKFILRRKGFMFFVIWLVLFIITVIVWRTVVERFVGFLGGSSYFFNYMTRAGICAVISLVLAIVVGAALNL